MTDVLPTLLELAGATSPGERNGVPAKSIDGSASRPVLRDGDAPSTHPEQYAEFGGNRGFYRDGWKIVTSHRPGTPFDDAEWELYDVAHRPQRAPRPVGGRAGAGRGAGEAPGSGPPGRTACSRSAGFGLSPVRRPAERELERPLRLLPGTPKLERYRSSQLINLRSFAVDIDVDHGSERPGRAGRARRPGRRLPGVRRGRRAPPGLQRVRRGSTRSTAGPLAPGPRRSGSRPTGARLPLAAPAVRRRRRGRRPGLAWRC